MSVISADQEWIEELDGEVEVGEQPDYSLPVILGRQEVERTLELGGLPLRLLYASGLRARELPGLDSSLLEGTRLRVADRTVELDAETARQLHQNWFECADLHQLWAEVVEQAGLTGRFSGRRLTPASLRHAYATHHLEKGMNLASLHRLLGHRCMATTLNYEQTAVGLRREEYSACHPLMRGSDRGMQAAAPTPDEMWDLVEAAESSRDRLLVCLFYATGVRLAEFLRLSPQDVDWHEHRIFVRTGKGDKDRYCLVDPTTLAELKGFLEPQAETLLGLNSATPVEKIVRRLAVRTGIFEKYRRQGKTISPHSFRHAFATHCYLNGMSPGALKKLLGHARLETTQIYLELPFAFVQGGVMRCHPLARHG